MSPNSSIIAQSQNDPATNNSAIESDRLLKNTHSNNMSSTIIQEKEGVTTDTTSATLEEPAKEQTKKKKLSGQIEAWKLSMCLDLPQIEKCSLKFEEINAAQKKIYDAYEQYINHVVQAQYINEQGHDGRGRPSGTMDDKIVQAVAVLYSFFSERLEQAKVFNCPYFLVSTQ